MDQTKHAGANEPIDLVLLKREVDALQIAMSEQRKPWYRNVSTLLSVIALLFSFGTTFVSYVRTHNQDLQSARVELRGLLQRLAALPRENVEMTKKYEADQVAVNMISGFINQENTLLARRAAEIVRTLPPEFVSATEYYATAMALQNAYNVEGARELLTKAVDTSIDLNDRVSALRSRGNLLFVRGEPDAGRVDYQRALDVFSGFPNVYDDYTKKSTHIWTELAWAYSEASIGARDAAMMHVGNAERYLSGLLPSPGAQQLRAQVGQVRTVLSANSPMVPSAPPPALSGQIPLTDGR